MRHYTSRYLVKGIDIANNRSQHLQLKEWNFEAEDDDKAIKRARQYKPCLPETILNPEIILHSLCEHREVSLKK